VADNKQEISNVNSRDFIEVNPVFPAGPAENLFIAGASVFEITAFTPPVQRVTILAINLPEPDTFGPYNEYAAILTVQGSAEPLETLILEPTEDNSNWAASTLLFFGGTIPMIDVEVRPIGFEREGEAILRGQVFP
jgi:hypothetical protein